MVLTVFLLVGILTFYQNVYTPLELAMSCRVLVTFGATSYKKVVSARCLFIYKNDVTDVFNADNVKLYTEVRSSGDLFCFQDCLDFLY